MNLILKNYFYNLSYKLLTILVPLITIPYIARILKANAIGAYSYTYTICSYFTLFGTLGLDMLGQLNIAKNRNHRQKYSKIFWNIFYAKFFMTSIAIGIYILVILVYQKYSTLLLILIILLIATIFEISWFYQGLEQFKNIMIKNFIVKIGSLLLIFTLIKSPKDIYLYAFILQMSMLLGNLSLWIRLKQWIVPSKVSWNQVLLNIKESFIYFIPTVAITIYTSTDLLMLGLIVNSNAENGIYNLTHKMEQSILPVITTLSTILLPRIAFLNEAGKREDSKRLIKTSIHITGMLGIPMMFGLFFCSSNLIPIFLGPGYERAIGLLKIFSIHLLFCAINTIVGNECLVAYGKQKQFNKDVIISAVCNVILNLLWIPRSCSYGAACASLISEIIVFFLFIMDAEKEVVNFKMVFDLWKNYLVFGIGMGLIVYLIGTIKSSVLILITEIIAGGFFYLFCLLFEKNDLIMDFLKEIKVRAFKSS